MLIPCSAHNCAQNSCPTIVQCRGESQTIALVSWDGKKAILISQHFRAKAAASIGINRCNSVRTLVAALAGLDSDDFPWHLVCCLLDCGDATEFNEDNRVEQKARVFAAERRKGRRGIPLKESAALLKDDSQVPVHARTQAHTEERVLSAQPKYARAPRPNCKRERGKERLRAPGRDPFASLPIPVFFSNLISRPSLPPLLSLSSSCSALPWHYILPAPVLLSLSLSLSPPLSSPQPNSQTRPHHCSPSLSTCRRIPF